MLVRSIQRKLLEICVGVLGLASGELHSVFACAEVEYRIIGAEKTDESWLREYLELEQSGVAPNDSMLAQIKKKLLSTDIFSDAEVAWVHGDPNSCQINIKIREKLTRIPVLRAVYGGGTPLWILGGYETHTFGKLYALGGELRRYGEMAPGAFLYFKSPRAWHGRGMWGGEIWLDRRRRSFFDSAGHVYGNIDSESWVAKFQMLYPWLDMDRGSLQIGFHSQASLENPAKFKSATNYKGATQGPPKYLELNERKQWSEAIGPAIAYDDLQLEGLNLDGIKAKATLGWSHSSKSGGSLMEGEIFAYKLFPADINLAARVFAGLTTRKSAAAVYYIGGFDSVRGLPDGVHYGNQMIYGNFELRVIAARFKYAHIQPTVFYDSGSVWIQDQNPHSGRETSLGGGVRIAVPQIYRMVLRIDYGFSIGHTKARGFSIALNQFFQPYKLVF